MTRIEAHAEKAWFASARSMLASPARGAVMSKLAIHQRPVFWLGLAMSLVVTLSVAATGASVAYTMPIVCNQGPSGQRFNVAVTLPDSVESGGVYTIRIDGFDSGKISHFGLNYLHGMTVEYLLPSGTSYVEGSARLVPGTGTANVLEGARVWQRDRVLTMQLPGHVENGSNYTPPSIVARVRAVGATGTSAVLGFNRFQLQANAFLVGDVSVSCDPKPLPYPIGTTRIVPRGDDVPNR
jgi:hypothetical protein